MQINIEKLVFGGQALGRTPEGKAAFIWNALPGEIVEIETLSDKKTHLEGIAHTIHQTSPERIAAKETCYLSTSPWQIMNFETENYQKRAIAAEQYSKIGDLILDPSKLKITSDGVEYGYRNKMEFSFCELEGKASMAFFERGKKVRIPVEGSALASTEINDAAKQILDWINTVKISLRSLKAMIIRSNSKGEVVAALFIKDKLLFDQYPKLGSPLVGFQLYYSTHKSPASVPTELLHTNGQDYLIEEILGTKLKYGIHSFFQINKPVFEMALKDIAAFLDPKKPVVDFYSGVGAISLPLSQNRLSTIMVDNNSEAIAFANENITLNNREHCEALCAPAEKLTEFITKDKTILLDPPRAGLHESVVKTLLARGPSRVIYMSCDIATHARDLRLLGQGYKLSFLQLYNFFPRTPHIEGLAVLDKI
jgi:23S rRNA (uracil1939-C5)-methyltransferase